MTQVKFADLPVGSWFYVGTTECQKSGNHSFKEGGAGNPRHMGEGEALGMVVRASGELPAGVPEAGGDSTGGKPNGEQGGDTGPPAPTMTGPGAQVPQRPGVEQLREQGYTVKHRKIPARYDSKCKFCSDKIDKGEKVQAVGQKGKKRDTWVHEGCAERALDGEPVPMMPDPARAHQPKPVAGGPAPGGDGAGDGDGQGQGEAGEQQKVDPRKVNEAAAREINAGASPLEAMVMALAEGVFERRFSGREEGDELQKAVDEAREQIQKALEKAQGLPRVIELKQPDRESVKLKGVSHEALPDILERLDDGLNVMMVGPTGSGKTFLAEQIAELLQLQYAFISCSVGLSEGQLLGRLLPVGEGGQFQYVRSEFVRTYEEGGVFLLDEFDGADPNTVLVLNAALAGAKLAVPNRPEKPYAEKHPDCKILVAGNTWGLGMDMQFVGRNQIDGATLNRFACGQVEVGYSKAIESALCPDEELRKMLWQYREKVFEHQLHRVISTRHLENAHHRINVCGRARSKVIDTVFSGWTKEDIEMVRGRLT